MIILDYLDKRPIYEQVTEKLSELIYKGILAADEQMPSVRNLAIDLSLNPNTVQRAYSELERAGLIYSIKGRGNYVADIAGLLPIRQRQFYDEVDRQLDRLPALFISKEELIEHIRQYEMNPV